MMRSAKWWLGLGALVGLGLAGVHSANAETLEWREEVALHDGGTLVAKGWIQLVPGEPFHTTWGARRLTFTHPTTGQPIVWENAGKSGSRVNPRLLDFDGSRTFLVTTAQAGSDYDGFGCRRRRTSFSDSTRRAGPGCPCRTCLNALCGMNLYPNPSAERHKEQNYFIGAAVTSERYKQAYRAGDEYKLRATVDRRIRNPLAMGRSRGAIERLYGVEKYDEWRGTGTWLNMTDDAALRLLSRKDEAAKP